MPHVISKFQGQSLFDRQAAQTVLQPVVNLRGNRGIDGLLGVVIEAAGTRMILLTANRLQRGAIGNPDDPRGNLRRTSKITGALPNDHEGIVDDLFDIFISLGKTRQKARQTPMVAKIQLLQGASIPCRDGGQQGAIALFGRAFGERGHWPDPLLLDFEASTVSTGRAPKSCTAP